MLAINQPSPRSRRGSCPALEGIDDVHSSDRLPLGVLGVGDGIADDILQEDLQHAPGLLVDEARDSLDASSPRKATDCRLRDALDVVPQNLSVPLSSSFAQALTSLTTSGHGEVNQVLLI